MQTVRMLLKVQHMCGLLSRSLAADIVQNSLDLQSYLKVSVLYQPTAPVAGDRVIHVEAETQAFLTAGVVAPHLAREAVCAQYAADTGLYDALHEVMLTLATDVLPPNPYPVLLSRLKRASLRYVSRSCSTLVQSWERNVFTHLSCKHRFDLGQAPREEILVSAVNSPYALDAVIPVCEAEDLFGVQRCDIVFSRRVPSHRGCVQRFDVRFR